MAEFALEKLFGKELKIRKKDGFISATQLCEIGGKRWDNYNQLKRTIALIAELQVQTFL